MNGLRRAGYIFLGWHTTTEYDSLAGFHSVVLVLGRPNVQCGWLVIEGRVHYADPVTAVIQRGWFEAGYILILQIVIQEELQLTVYLSLMVCIINLMCVVFIWGPFTK